MKMMDEMVLVTYLKLLSDLVAIVRSNARLELAKKNSEKSTKQ
jgi:L-aspartate oxidase